jgi:hypothetical protein
MGCSFPELLQVQMPPSSFLRDNLEVLPDLRLCHFLKTGDVHHNVQAPLLYPEQVLAS